LAPTTTQVWPQILDVIEENIGSARFDLWFRNTEVEDIRDGLIEVGTPNLFVASWLERHFTRLVEEAFARALHRPVRVRFVASGTLFQEARQRQDEEMAQLLREGGAGRAAPADAPARVSPRVRRDYTFANYVVGPCNRLACAAGLEVVAKPDTRLNPLFLYSECGLGKTHLLQAIWHAVNDCGDGRHAEYVTAETFTNEFTFAMRNGCLDSFRRKYREGDILLIDDVQFFDHKKGLQGEFLHTFDALDTARKQIVLASDSHPRSMTGVRKGLVSRLLSGMIAEMTQPSFETRLQIIRMTARRLRKQMNDEVMEYIAGRPHDNIRELQGAVQTLLAYAALAGCQPDLSMTREVFAAQPSEPEGPRSMAAIEGRVCEMFQVPARELHTRKRTRTVVIPRQACMYLARKFTDLSCGEIAAHFGSRHHTTVLFAEKSVSKRRRKDASFGEKIDALETQLAGQR